MLMPTDEQLARFTDTANKARGSASRSKAVTRAMLDETPDAPLDAWIAGMALLGTVLVLAAVALGLVS